MSSKPRTGALSTPDGPSPSGRLPRLAARLHSAAIGLLRSVRTVDRDAGLSAARLSALSVVVFGGPLTLRELADAEQVTSATMSRLVSALADEGLLRREPHPSDGRARLLVATARGRRLLEKERARRVERLVETLLEELSAEELEALERAVEILERAAVAKAPESPGPEPGPARRPVAEGADDHG